MDKIKISEGRKETWIGVAGERIFPNIRLPNFVHEAPKNFPLKGPKIILTYTFVREKQI
jgi:hypothetical protein